jgi:short subunit fatty acids transporter
MNLSNYVLDINKESVPMCVTQINDACINSPFIQTIDQHTLIIRLLAIIIFLLIYYNFKQDKNLTKIRREILKNEVSKKSKKENSKKNN